MDRPCGNTSCPALADRQYCTVHGPEALLARVKKIVADQCFLAAAAATSQRGQDLIVKLRDNILSDLEQTK